MTGIDSLDTTVVQARWPVAVGERTGVAPLANVAKVADRVTIWVDQDGNPVAPPTPTWHAVADAVGAVEAVVILVAVATTLLVTCVRSRLDLGHAMLSGTVNSDAWWTTVGRASCEQLRGRQGRNQSQGGPCLKLFDGWL